jgi:8-oxo-dGTP diphosphatase
MELAVKFEFADVALVVADVRFHAAICACSIDADRARDNTPMKNNRFITHLPLKDEFFIRVYYTSFAIPMQPFPSQKWFHNNFITNVGNGMRFGYILSMEQKITRVAVGILKRENNILLCQRKKGGRYELKWEFPGGKLEQGEGVEECLIRELREELSIESSDIHIIETQSAFYEDGGIFEVTYCEVGNVAGEMTNNVFEQFRWVPISELPQFDILEGNKPFVAKLVTA